MPRKRRNVKQRRAEVTPEMRAYLTDELEHLFFFENPEITDAWASLAAEIVESWARSHPGTRPRMWWRLDAPEPGRLSNGAPLGGAPNRLCIPAAVPTLAQQKRFLRRHGLFLPGELARLNDSDPPDEAA